MLIDFRHLFPRHGVCPSGILHIGANTGQELPVYHELGIKKICFVEPIPDVFRTLVENCQRYGKDIDIMCFQSLCTDQHGTDVVLNIASNGGQSSSILPLGTHKHEHPSVRYRDAIRMKSTTVDTMYQRYGLCGMDFLNIDVQGAELLVLKGMAKAISDFKWVYLEVNREPLYEGCALYHEIEDHLGSLGFAMTEIKWTNHGWGDAFFTKT